MVTHCIFFSLQWSAYFAQHVSVLWSAVCQKDLQVYFSHFTFDLNLGLLVLLRDVIIACILCRETLVWAGKLCVWLANQCWQVRYRILKNIYLGECSTELYPVLSIVLSVALQKCMLLDLVGICLYIVKMTPTYNLSSKVYSVTIYIFVVLFFFFFIL